MFQMLFSKPLNDIPLLRYYFGTQLFFLLVTPPLHQNWSAVDMQGGTDSLATSPKPGTAYDKAAAESMKL